MYYLCILALLGNSVLYSADGVENEFRNNANAETSLIRSKRRTSCIEWGEWQCRDGSCIRLDLKCDGTYDCPDKSDETHAVCRNMACQRNWFRCTYGARVDGTAPCNGVQDCGDNSDELLPRCRNQTLLFSRDVPCDDGEMIPETSRCDGVIDCADESDETLATCADAYCHAYYFQCAYGACVGRGVQCDGKNDCADGSDEDNVLCNKTMPMDPKSTTEELILPGESQHTTEAPNLYKKCKLPPYPEHGSYNGVGFFAFPGEDLVNGHMIFTCSEGYRMIGESRVFCFYGRWLNEFPKCALSARSLEFVPDMAIGSPPITSWDGIPAKSGCTSAYPFGDNRPSVPLFTAADNGSSESSSLCVLPEYPEHGTYELQSSTILKPGQSLESFVLNYTCQQPYRLVGHSVIFCVSGVWSEPLPTCARFCKLEDNPTAEYKCITAGGNEPRACDENEPSGTLATPACRVGYYSTKVLPNMKCLDGSWDYVASCIADVHNEHSVRDQEASPTLVILVTQLRKMYLLLFCLVSASAPLFTAAHKGSSESSSLCVLPEYPEHGTYELQSSTILKPGQSLESFVLNYTCQQPYRLVGHSVIFCVSGVWSDPLPTCARFCKLEDNPTAEYKCITAGGNEPRLCNENEPSGTLATPACRVGYYSTNVLPNMKCLDGSWDYVASCVAECGTIAPDGLPLDGYVNNIPRELPWYAGIYAKTFQPYIQICAGTLVTPSAVISAAHCFWADNTVSPKEIYAVALGKTFRRWTSQSDKKAHKSDVKDIHIPPQYTGRTTNYQNDIAVVIMADSVSYKVHIRPICLNFDAQFENMQLKAGNLGKVGVWNLSPETLNQRKALKVVDIPYIDALTCISRSPETFRNFITGEKMCVGYYNGTGPCRGDGGAGLAFPNQDRGVERYYLRGVISTAPASDSDFCSPEFVLATIVSAHEHFIKQYLF